MSIIYRGMDRAALDAAYNNSAAVETSASLMQQFDGRSALLRARYRDRLDFRYGPAGRNRIDYFAAPKPGPLLVFIHGGYWQMRAKENFSFLAAGALVHGIHVAMVGYTLAPEATLTQIVGEIRASLGWLRANATGFGGDTERMIVSGWSAGGHLAAMTIDEPGVAGALAISGIYDLEPVRLCYVDEKLRLSDTEVRALSPLRLAQSAQPLVLAYGTAELSELRRQSVEFAKARGEGATELIALPERNHFTILEDLADPAGPITDALRRLIAKTVR